MFIYTSTSNDIYDRILFHPFNSKDASTNISNIDFYQFCQNSIIKILAKNISQNDIQFILSNGANEDICSLGGGTTGALAHIDKFLFDSPQELKNDNQNIIDHSDQHEKQKFTSAIKKQQMKYKIMTPYYTEHTTEYRGYSIIGVNHIISISIPTTLQFTKIYKDIFIANIKTIIRNANTKAINKITCLWLCSTPGEIYKGYMWLNTYYTLLAIKDIKDEIHQKLFIVLDGSLSDVEISKKHIEDFKNGKFDANNTSITSHYKNDIKSALNDTDIDFNNPNKLSDTNKKQDKPSDTNEQTNTNFNNQNNSNNIIIINKSKIETVIFIIIILILILSLWQNSSIYIITIKPDTNNITHNQLIYI
jgi:hypothetical protein